MAAADVSIRLCQPGDVDDWASLRTLLWPGDTPGQHAEGARTALADPKRFVGYIARTADGRACGFVEGSLRTDYVNGCKTSPVAFVEGIFVSSDVRRQGVARRLLAAIEAWGRDKGCTELASDMHHDNHTSLALHRNSGFEVTSHVIFLRKPIG